MFEERKLFVFPGNIKKEILDLGREQIPYMRTEEFSEIYNRCSARISYLADCKLGKTLIYTMSGTAALESAVLSFCKNKKSVSINAGGFGARWKEIADYHSIDIHELVIGSNNVEYYSQLECYINNNKVDVLMMQHHETSTGELLNIHEVGEICKRNNVLFIVDAISSFLSDEISMDDMNIDIMIVSSQKALNIPPGLALITMSKNALEQYQKSSFYYDYENNINNLRRGQTPFSPATQLFIQLDKKLDLILSMGKDKYLLKTKEKSMFFKKLCIDNDWVINIKNTSNAITAFRVSIPSRELVNQLIKKNIYVMPGGDEHLIRVSHTGEQTRDDLINLANEIKKAEREYNEK